MHQQVLLYTPTSIDNILFYLLADAYPFVVFENATSFTSVFFFDCSDARSCEKFLSTLIYLGMIQHTGHYLDSTHCIDWAAAQLGAQDPDRNGGANAQFQRETNVKKKKLAYE
jgi:hypothetical protein